MQFLSRFVPIPPSADQRTMAQSELSNSSTLAGSPPGEAALIARDSADLLYKHAVGGIGVSVVSSSLLALVLSRTASAGGFWPSSSRFTM